MIGLLGLMASVSWISAPRLAAQDSLATKESAALFARDNLVAWCIVPFDASKRTPQQRAQMLKELGIRRLAYDYRAEHIPQFEEEIQQLARHGIELTAWWFPGELNEEAKGILALLEKHHLKTQLWVTGGGGPVASAQEQAQRVAGEVARLRPIAEAAQRIGCQVGLYNHGGWFGEPENQIAIIQALGMTNVGIVYNQHHGHDQIDRFESLLQKMLPHLIAVNLNGMIPQGDRKGQKIVPLGGGSEDRRLLQILAASGYRGPIGILNHTDLDARARLEDNLRGLDWLLDASPDRPGSIAFTTWRAPAEPTLGGGILFDSLPALRLPPITVQCRARLDQRDAYNILLASDAKSSGEHWELYTEAGSGRLAVYVPGSEPSILTSSVDVCDGKSHLLTMGYEANRMRLWVDGRLVLDSAIAMKPGRQGDPGQ
jgi:sugar phosphate isomerase/epimerase